MPETPSPSPVTWLLELELDATVTLPDGAAVPRPAFLDWMWAAAENLTGIDEGAVDSATAAAAGFVDAALVIDTAAAPADRDWVGRLSTARVTCGFTTAAAAHATAADLAGLPGCRVGSIRAQATADTDAWRAAFGPIAVDGFGTVRPAWEPGFAADGRGGTTIFIEPGIGFGTGLHETTRLCLAAIVAWHRADGGLGRVLDFGAGSGILGIAAAVLGAGHVEAVECDTSVHAAIRSNAARNGVAERIRVAAGLAATTADCDLVVANIVAGVLADQAAVLCGRVRRGASGGPAGCLVLSGLTAAEVPAIAARYAALLGTAPATAALGGWHCLRFG